MKMNFTIYIVACLLLASCNKFLEKKPNQKLVVPTTLRDLQALLEDPLNINYAMPVSGELSAGDLYVPDNVLAELDESVRNLYLWNKANLFATTNEEWALLYKVIYRCNIVLEEIEKITPVTGEQEQWKAVKGNALFLRASSYTQLAWLWSLAYDAQTAASDPGVALRLSANFNEVSRRTNIENSYRQIISDLEQASQLLPVISAHVITPCRPAAYGQLARVLLSMQEYDKALAYADSSLALRSELMNYNNSSFINGASAFPFTRYNPEMLYLSGSRLTTAFDKGIADTTLYDSYEANDLRKTLFFNGRKTVLSYFRGNYEGKNSSGVLFFGPAVDEMYLIRAECRVRKGIIDQGLSDLNTLLRSRYKTGTYNDYTGLTATEAIHLVLHERRKELIFRGLRWSDIKRLNKEGANIALTRKMNQEVYRLEPNSPRYALEIPQHVIDLSGMQQNPR